MRGSHAIASLSAAVALGACATRVQVPEIPILDSPAFAAVQREPDPKPAVQYIEVPKPLPLPGQLKPVTKTAQKGDERPPKKRVTGANAAARIEPVKDGLVSVSAGDTVRWVVGDTSSGEGKDARVHILVKPVGADLETNLVVTTDRRTYHLEMKSSQATYMASVSWTYPGSELVSLRKQRTEAEIAATAVADVGIKLEQLRFRYRIEGDAPWKPTQVFDDGAKVYIQFPSGLSQSEAPSLFVIGPDDKPALVNYRVRGTCRGQELALGHHHAAC